MTRLNGHYSKIKFYLGIRRFKQVKILHTFRNLVNYFSNLKTGHKIHIDNLLRTNVQRILIHKFLF